MQRINVDRVFEEVCRIYEARAGRRGNHYPRREEEITDFLWSFACPRIFSGFDHKGD